MSKDVENLIVEYEKVFKSHFPMYPLGEMDEKDLKEVLTDCISQKKTVYDLGYLPDPSKDLEMYY